MGAKRSLCDRTNLGFLPQRTRRTQRLRSIKFHRRAAYSVARVACVAVQFLYPKAFYAVLKNRKAVKAQVAMVTKLFKNLITGISNSFSLGSITQK